MRVNYQSNAAQVRLVTYKRLSSIMPAVRRSEEQSGAIIKARAEDLSRGSFSTADLRRLGHPYRIGGSPPANPAIINAQTGRFLASWHFQVETSIDTVSLFVFNDAPWAKYMLGGGKSRMIPRPILQLLVKLEAPGRLRRLRAAFGLVLQQGK